MSPYKLLTIKSCFKLAVKHTSAPYRRPKLLPGPWERCWSSAWYIKGQHWRLRLSDSFLQKGTRTLRNLPCIMPESNGSVKDISDLAAVFTESALFHQNIWNAAWNLFLVCLHKINLLICKDYTNTKVIHSPLDCTHHCKGLHLPFVCLEWHQVYRKQTPSLMVYGGQFPAAPQALTDENFPFFCIVFTYQLPIY